MSLSIVRPLGSMLRPQRLVEVGRRRRASTRRMDVVGPSLKIEMAAVDLDEVVGDGVGPRGRPRGRGHGIESEENGLNRVKSCNRVRESSGVKVIVYLSL